LGSVTEKISSVEGPTQYMPFYVYTNLIIPKSRIKKPLRNDILIDTASFGSLEGSRIIHLVNGVPNSGLSRSEARSKCARKRPEDHSPRPPSCSCHTKT